MSDETKKSAAADDPEALGFAERLARFCKAHHRKFEQQLSKRLPPDAAGDVLQTAYEDLLRSPPPPEEIGDFPRYFGGILRYGAFNWWREERRRRRMEHLLKLALDGVPVDVLPSGACVCIAQQMQAQLVILGRDDPEAVQAFLLVRVDGLSVQRAARRLGVSRHQVSRRICRALVHLESVYKPGEPT